MKMLITGGTGQVAYDIKKILTARGIDFIAPSRKELPLTDLDAVIAVLRDYQPDFVINAAAYTAVDMAEKEVGNAYTVNFFGAKHLAIACEKFSCPLLHISTDYIFDGDARTPYREEDIAKPHNVYGQSKLHAEEFIREHVKNYMILRVSAVFGVHGHNFVKTILRLAREKETLRIVSDQITCPTPSKTIAETLLKMCETPKWGIYHYCGQPEVSWYDFAKKIIEVARKSETFLVKKIEPIPSIEYPTLAKRPYYSVLDCHKIKNVFGIEQPSWEEGLKHVIEVISVA